MPADPRTQWPQRPRESNTAYAARLTALRWPCGCGCGRPLAFRRQRLGRSLFRAAHNPATHSAEQQAARARRAVVSPEGRARKRAASLAWWTPARRAAFAARIAFHHRAGRYASHGAVIRSLWRSGHTFGIGRRGLRRWRGGIKGELLAKFPEHAPWIASLTDADLEGLLSTNQEHDTDGAPLGDVLKAALLGEARERESA